MESQCDVKNVYIEQVEVKGDVIRIPVNGNLTLPEEGGCWKVARDVLYAALAVLGSAPQTGGCRAFYTPAEWDERNEEHGLNSILILVHDGGDFAQLCNHSYECYALMDSFNNELEKRGYYIESCTCWYSAVYLADKNE